MARIAVVVVTALLSAACGRVDFDRLHDDGGGPPGDAGGDAINTPRANVVFATSTAHAPGSLGGLAGADAICSARAMEAGLTGTFVAYLSTSTVNAPDRLGSARGWIRPDGKMVADQISDLIAGNLFYSIGLDEHGVDVAGGAGNPGTWVSTGTSDGLLAADNCADYTDPAANILVGAAGMVHTKWMSRATFPCSMALHLYCFETDRVVPLSITTATGRLAFVSTGMFSPTTGRATADSICATEAAMAGKTGTFLALLPEGAATAASRFDLAGPVWVRTDGVRLADTNDAFMTTYTQAALDLTVNGTRVETYVQIGSDSPAFNTGADCVGWSSTTGGSNYGNTYSAGGGMFNDTSSNCTDPQPVYCLEL